MKPTSILLSAVALLSLTARPLAATDRPVDCGPGSSYLLQAAVDQLKSTDPNGPNTITVSGVCKERAVIIESLRNLTIEGDGSAVIMPDDNWRPVVVAVVDSFNVTLKRLTITGASFDPPYLLHVRGSQDVEVEDATLTNGGTGVFVDTHSDVTLSSITAADNTIGVRVDHNSTADLQSTTVITGSATGLRAANRSTVSISGLLTIDNVTGSGYGINAEQSGVTITGCGTGSSIRRAMTGLGAIHGSISVTCPLSVEDNTSYGALGGSFSLSGGAIVQRNGATLPNPEPHGRGVFVFGGEELAVQNAKIIDNYGAGIEVNRGSNAMIVGATVTGNRGEGIRLTELSVAGFWVIPSGPPNVVSGNTDDDIVCDASSHGYGIRPAAAKIKCPTFNWRPYEGSPSK